MDKPEQMIEDLRRLVSVTKVITSSLSVDEQLPLIMDAVIALTNADKAMLLLFENGRYEVRAERPAPADTKSSRPAYSTGVINQVVESGEPLFILDTDLHAQMARQVSVQAMQLRTVMCTPLRSRTGIFGVLYVHASTPLLAFNERKKEIFNSLSDYASIALDNARLFTASISDPMTALYNHSYGQRRLDEELMRAKRHGRHLSFALIDVDKFKAVNDSYGHRKGDALICGIASALRGSVRQTDIVARYGGDEFAIIMPETGGSTGAPGSEISGSRILAERLRDKLNVELVAGVPKISASIGIACYPVDFPNEKEREDLTPGDLVDRADKALYAAKRLGGNRVCDAHEQAAAPSN